MPKFEKGVSGNPKGRPVGSVTISGLLKNIGNQPIPESVQKKIKNFFPDLDTKKMTFNEAIAYTNYYYAIDGKSWANAQISDRTEGKAVERTADVSDKWHEIIESAYSETE
tara:strand:- start:2024 stop:2356 length:333 start_codon:yes stop_codon:yes gene_type:complete